MKSGLKNSFKITDSSQFNYTHQNLITSNGKTFFLVAVFNAFNNSDNAYLINIC